MNINLLKDNPHWGWYLLVGGACLSLTFTVFLVFKFTSVRLLLNSSTVIENADMTPPIARGYARQRSEGNRTASKGNGAVRKAED